MVNASINGVAGLRILAQQSLSLCSERLPKIESFQIQGPVAVATIAFYVLIGVLLCSLVTVAGCYSDFECDHWNFRTSVII